MYKDWENDEKNETKHFKTILKEYTKLDFFTACLNQIGDDTKDKVKKCVALWDIILETYFDLKELVKAWNECARFMAFNSSDFPLATAAIAIVLKKIMTHRTKQLEAGTVREFYI
jgi:hypothetical protein